MPLSSCDILIRKPLLQAKQNLRDLIAITKDDHFLENELVTEATQAVTTCIR